MKSPIILFTYNRLKETIQTIEKLKNANNFEEFKIYIYSDGPKNSLDETKIKKVREYLKGLNKFKNIEIVYSSKNNGLAKSVIEGVSKILETSESVIVLEDDLIISKDFLNYMNDALNVYKKRKDIWSISGFGPNIKVPKEYAEDMYLTLRGCSWGWGTWKDRWETVQWNIDDFDKIKKSKSIQNGFNISGNDMFKMLELQMLGKINSWAIRWCYSQFKQTKYTIYPIKSKIQNIGFGDDATHEGIFIDKHMVQLDDKPLNLNPNIQIDLKILKNFKKLNDLSFYSRVGYFLKKYNLGYKIIKRIIKKIIK